LLDEDDIRQIIRLTLMNNPDAGYGEVENDIKDEIRRVLWMSRSVLKLNTARNQLPLGLSDRETAERLGISLKDFHEFLADRHRGMLEEFQEAADRVTPEDNVEFMDLMMKAVEAVKRLPHRERYVVIQHFFEHRLMKDIAYEMAVSPARVSQILSGALDRLRNEL
jgi:RNA polymerase sigma factor (sigma-70 family)